ncbi:MAG: DUF4065 domain-containing protein [Clostridia bacterium]|nr:DUF4065 domain-containing protein [Clostridia bacterium]
MSKDILDDFTFINEDIVTTDGVVSSDAYNIFTLANAFLTIDSMTHKKLQKLCYYAKAWYLALNDENIIFENFEAWVHGAVNFDLYQKYRSYGFSLIPMFDGDVNDIPEEFLSFAREIYEAYGDLSGDDLEKINHQETPWLSARKGLKPWQSSDNIISEDEMKIYYRKLMNNEQQN